MDKILSVSLLVFISLILVPRVDSHPHHHEVEVFETQVDDHHHHHGEE